MSIIHEPCFKIFHGQDPERERFGVLAPLHVDVEGLLDAGLGASIREYFRVVFL